MPKRRAPVQQDDPEIFGDLGTHKLLKPIDNKDVPADATITNINVIGSTWRPYQATPAKTGRQQHGQTLVFAFKEEECPNVCPIPENPMAAGKQKVPIQKIFDIDIESMMHDVEESRTEFFASKGSAYPDVIKYVDDAATHQTAYDLNTGSGFAEPAVFDGQPSSLTALHFALVIVGRAKQKILGDWIQKHTTTTTGTIGEMTPWLFDRMCYDIKPIYACHFMAGQTNEASKHYMKVGTGSGYVHVPVPEVGDGNKLLWRKREFHRYQDSCDTSLAESFANTLLISVIGQKASFQNFDSLRMRIYHTPEKIEQQTLDYWYRNVSKFMFDVARGSRHEVGAVDFLPAGAALPTTGDWNFGGVYTSQIGDILALANFKVNASGAETNVLQDTANEAQVPGWYF